jgi:hypothetical protein
VRVPFVTRGSSSAVPDDLVEFYRTLPKQPPTTDSPGSPKGLWVHQGEITRAYAPSMINKQEVALQLPTGAGKTLVGGLIGEWRRRRFGDRVVFVCPTKQLADQTIKNLALYGITAVKLVGRQRDWPQPSRTRYSAAQAIAVTTYPSIFNTNPALDDANVLILDDAHAAEGYVASLWSLKIWRSDPAYTPVLDTLVPALDPLVASRLRQPDGGDQYTNQVYLASAVGVAAVAGDLSTVLHRSSDAGGLNSSAQYALRTLQDHLGQALIYVSYGSILIRPLISPTATHPAFEAPKQRLYMSATLGEGGELERAFGRTKIKRIPIPSGWDRQGTGRRYFVFPDNSSDLAVAEPSDQATWMSGLIDRMGKAVLLTPDNRTRKELTGSVVPAGMEVLAASDVEDDLDVFAKAPRGVLALNNRYDGLDLPDDDCRLVVVAGLPARGDLQERFLTTDLGAIEVLHERIRARIVQGAGRATRNPTDFAVVAMLGADLASFVARDDVQRALHPEVHAELDFSLENSYGTSAELTENIGHFLDQDEDWRAAETDIITQRDTFTQVTPPGSAELAAAAPFEVAAWQALWQGEPERAMEQARRVIDTLNRGQGSRRYAALWNYLLGSWATTNGGSSGDPAKMAVARTAFEDARADARATTWMAHAVSNADQIAMTGTAEPEVDPLDAAAIEQAAARLDAWRRPRVFDPLIDEITTGLAQTEHRAFENALVKLGQLTGASESVGDGNANAAPDASWTFGTVLWVAWEAKSEADAAGEVSVDCVRQANGHLRYMENRLVTAIPSGSVSVLTTPQVRIHPTAVALAEDHTRMVTLAFPLELGRQLEQAWRTIRASVGLDLDPEQIKKVIREAFATNQCLPTQWVGRLNGHPVRATSA